MTTSALRPFAYVAPDIHTGTWLDSEVALLITDPTAADYSIHVLHDDSVPRWHLALVDSLLWVLGYCR